MDNSPNDIFGKDVPKKEEKIEPLETIDSNKGVMHNHTMYSIYDGVQTPLELVRAAKTAGYKNICLSDHGSLMGLSPFLKACEKEGVNGIPGVEIYITDPDYPEARRGHMCLYAVDNEGLKIISKIQGESYKNHEESGIVTKKIFPITTLKILETYVKKGHVIATSACVNGLVSQVLCGNPYYTKKYLKLQDSLIEYDIDEINKIIEKANKTEEERDACKKQVGLLANISTTPLSAELKNAKTKEEKEDIKKEIEKRKADNKVKTEKRKELNEKIKELNALLKVLKPQRTQALKDKESYEKIIGKMNELPIVPVEERKERTMTLLSRLKKIFGDNFYIELQYHGLENEKEYYPQIAQIAKGFKMVVANDAHYDVKGRDKQRWLVASAGSITYYDMINLPDETDDQYYVKTEEELKAKLSEILPANIIDEAIKNTYEVLEGCKVTIDNSLHFPKFPVPENMSSEDYLKKLTYDGIQERWGQLKPEVKDRADYELDVINSMGYTDYILIVRDYVMHGREVNENYVGSGRGSAYGSLVCWLIGITEGVNPMEYDLLFERFLNPERVSMPDVDVDFAEAIRSKMFDYVASKYGHDHVSHISTITITQTKSAYKTACRVIEKAVGESDDFLKLFSLTKKDLEPINNLSYARPFLKLGDALSKAYDASLKELNVKDLKPEEITNKATLYGIFGKKIVDLVISYASTLFGMPSALGLHAAGCIISDNPITDYVPVRTSLNNEGEEIEAIEADMIQAEEDFGLLKMDFLGLTTLDIIAETINNIEKTQGYRLNVSDIPVNDEKVYKEIFATGKTNGIFQFESNFMKDILMKVKPDKFDDIVLINAIGRPGPMQYIDAITEVKNGKKKPYYITNSIKPILEVTYGYPVYQEQLMQIFNKGAGFSLGEADIIRRLMSKKKTSEFAKYKTKFIKGLIQSGADQTKAEDFWEQLLKFSEYAFNKSHSVAYSLLAYRCAWLKFYYPKEFACSVLAYEDDEVKKNALIQDLRSMGVKVSPVDFRTVQILPTITGTDSISIGLTNIKGLGKKMAESIIEYRNNLDTYELVDILSLPPAAVDLMASIGMFDYLNISRYEIKNIAEGKKFEGEKLLDDLEAKENEIEELYEKFSQESGLDINKIKLNNLPFTDSELSDTQYINRIKKINKLKEDRKKILKKYREKASYIQNTQNALQQNIFKLTLEDKKNEIKHVGFYLGETPLEMSDISLLKVIAKDNLLTNPADLNEGEEAYFPLIVTSGFVSASKNGNEYLTLIIEDKPYRSFDGDILEKARELDLVNLDIFKFCLLKIKKKNGYCNIVEIVQIIDTDKKEARMSVRNREVLKEVTRNKKEPIRVYIESENKYVHVMGEIKESLFARIF